MFIIMTVMRKDVEDLSVQLDNCTLIIKYPDVTYSYFKNLVEYRTDEDLEYILHDILIYLDCSFLHGDKRVIMTTHMNYERWVSEFYYYLLHLENQIDYNYYFDELLTLHQANVNFELANPIVIEVPKKKVKSTVKKVTKGKFVRQVTTNMFTNEEEYIYSNSTTGETINSSDPDLLDGLNGVKVKREKKVKQVGVPMTSMMFSFKKKTND